MYLQGVALEYTDYDGALVRIPDQHRQAVLSACGYDIGDSEAVARSNFLLDAAPWQQLLPATVFTRSAAPQLSVQLPETQGGDTVVWELLNDAGSVAAGQVIANLRRNTGCYTIDSVRYVEHSWSVPAIAPGYYRYMVSVDGVRAESMLIASPEQAYNPCTDSANIDSFKTDSSQTDNPDAEQRPWGISTQLYSVRSEHNYGIGDFGDLSRMVTLAAAEGADFVMLNPLHALFHDDPERASPYSPSDRFLLNPLYIYPDDCEDFSASDAVTQLCSSATFRRRLQYIKASGWVDYSAVFKLKYEVFALMFEQFGRHELATASSRARAFNEFCEQHSECLQAQADWLQQRLYAGTGTDTAGTDTDTDIGTGTGKSATDIGTGTDMGTGTGKSAEIPPNSSEFFFYLQWLAQQQLQAVQQLAIDQTMSLGLIRDLAVGCAGDGSEAKRHQQLFVSGASVGAPPDPIGPQGQNWGLPPINPVQLKADKYRHFIQLIAANMRDCGALRIDHVMGLLRLWWCLETEDEAAGCYVYYPFQQLVEILKIESVLNRCVIIGEDLGIVPEPVKVAMAEAQIYSNLMFYFEKDHQGHFRPLSHLNPRSLLMIANHDVAPFTCWWQNEDLEIRLKLDLFNSELDYHHAVQQRQQDKDNLLQWVRNNQADPAAAPESLSPLPLFKQLALTLAGSQARLFALQLEDLDDQPAPVNIPGTDRQYPNWRRRLSLPLEALFADTGFFAALHQARRTP